MTTRIGCDLVSVAEVSASIARFGDRYLRRVWTDAELQDCAGPDRAARLAARFAAKEAVAKVLGDLEGPLPWRCIAVTRSAGGRPTVSLSGPAAVLAAASGLVEFDVSLSHERGMALAVVCGTGDAASRMHQDDPIRAPTEEDTDGE